MNILDLCYAKRGSFKPRDKTALKVNISAGSRLWVKIMIHNRSSFTKL